MENFIFDLDDYDDSKQNLPTPITETNTEQEIKIMHQALTYEKSNLDTQNELENILGIKTCIEYKYISSPTVEPNLKQKSQVLSEETQDIDDLLDIQPKINISLTTTSKFKEEKKVHCHAIDDEVDVNELDKITDPALTFPFELDIFQKRSIIRLERHENVLVCAHTSSGKTAVAEYAIAIGRRNNKRVFYTSPIKALSNQKYREFTKKFDDVGILTGDVSINSDAQCLIMTTEILQSSLYKNSEMLNLVEWVIFDEVHYINDNERGHVWEEILILLPPRIGIVMLSATVPNYLEFAKWVGRIKNTTIYIQNTLQRVVPLEHKIFLDPTSIFIAKDKLEKVHEDTITQAVSTIFNKYEWEKRNSKIQRDRQNRQHKLFLQLKAFNKSTGKREMKNFNKDGRGYTYQSNKISLTHLKIEEMVNFLFKNNLTPAVMFVFSIKKIDEYASMLSGDMRIEGEISHKILSFFDKCMSKLSEEDRKINQIQVIRKMLPTGIGVHHAGLLPILKETIEILYSKGLIKILFATTSFSLGLNMPTRTVVFTEILKYNEEKKEILSSSEYLQMCGRAGRRGIDDLGNVFLLMGDKQSPPGSEEISMMMGASGTEVESKFRLSYRTIISFLSRNIKNIVEFFKESYLENANLMTKPELMKDMNELKSKLIQTERIQCKYIDCDDYMRKYDHDTLALKKARAELFGEECIIWKLKTYGRAIVYYNKILMRNVVIIVLYYYVKYGEIWCLMVDNNPKPVTLIRYEDRVSQRICENSSQTTHNDIQPAPTQFTYSGNINGRDFSYFSITLDEIVEILDVNIKIDPELHYIEDDNGYFFLTRKEMIRVMNELDALNKKPDLKVLDYLKVSRNDNVTFDHLTMKSNLETAIVKNKCNDCHLKAQHLLLLQQRKELQEKYDDKSKMMNQENLKQYEEFNARLQILKKLGYIDEENQILLKGKAAREIATTDCVMITELLMSNVFEKLELDEIVGFISGFAFSKNEVDFTDPRISNNFSEAFEEFHKIYENLVNLEQAFNFEENKYNRRIIFSVSKPLKLWVQGKQFYEIIRETDLEEGKLYNLIMRLFLFFEEIKNFYGVLGNSQLAEKFSNLKGMLMRDILACKSLYLQEDIDIDDI